MKTLFSNMPQQHFNYKYLRRSTFSRVSLSTLADEMACAAFGTYQYEDYMSTFKKHAKKLDCPIEELRAQEDESVYDVEF